jgi:hypothetical protein
VIEVRVLEPIPTAGMAEQDMDRLMEETRRRMQAALDDLARRALPAGSSVAAPEERRGGSRV